MSMDLLRRTGRFRPAAVLFLLLISYGSIAYGLLISNGMYQPEALLCIGIGWVTLCVAAVLFRRVGGFSAPSILFLRIACAILLLLFLFLGRSVTPGIYIQQPDYIQRFRTLSSLIGFLVVIIVALSSLRSLHRFRTGIFIACVLFFASLYFGMLRASPAPVIDVFSMLRDSSSFLLQGQNPYTTPFTDPYGGAQGLPWPKMEVFGYPPSILLAGVGGNLVAGDVRFFSVLSILFVGFFLWRVARKKDDATGQLLCLLWLALPRGLFVVEQSWIDPVALALLCVALLLLRPKLLHLAVAVFGLFVSVKQYFILAIPPALRIVRSPRYLLWFVLPPAFVALPFFIWDPRAFIDNAILFQLRTGFRSDSLSMAVLFPAAFGATLGKWLSLAMGLIATGMTMFLPAVRQRTTFVFSLALIFLSCFFLGTQAFCNYYYFVCGLIIMTLALMIGEEEGRGPG